MIDSAHLKRLLLGAALLIAAASALSIALGAPLSFAGGLLLGFVLGAAPFLSWAWIASRTTAGKRSRVLSIVLLALKLPLYGGALYLGVTRQVVNPIAVMLGIPPRWYSSALGAHLEEARAAFGILLDPRGRAAQHLHPALEVREGHRVRAQLRIQ